jgi:two-component system, LytTR family, sensor kinase
MIRKKIMAAVLKHLKTLLRESAILLAIGLVITITFSGVSFMSNRMAFVNTILYNLAIGLSLWRGNSFLSGILDHYLPGKVSLERQLIIHLVATLVFSAIIIFLINYFLYAWLYGRNLLNNLRLFFLIGMVQLFIVVIITGFFYVMDFIQSHKRAVKEQEALKREALHHNYEALKSQLSPHFLFNSLSVLSALVEQDAQKSQVFIKQLSDVYRYVLEQKGAELVTLEKELEFVHAYVYLLQIRHDSNLEVVQELESTRGYVIPMSVQLLVENALKHNEVSGRNPLTIQITRKGDTISVSNNLQPRKGIPGNGLGLNLLRKRCLFLLGREVEVIRENESFTVNLPVADEAIIARYED